MQNEFLSNKAQTPKHSSLKFQINSVRNQKHDSFRKIVIPQIQKPQDIKKSSSSKSLTSSKPIGFKIKLKKEPYNIKLEKQSQKQLETQVENLEKMADKKSQNGGGNPEHFLTCDYYVKAVKKIFSQKIKVNKFSEHFQKTMMCVQLAQTIEPNLKEVHLRKQNLPKTDKKTLIFDLDETLIHCTQMQRGEIVIPVKTFEGHHINANINVRPYAQKILEEMSKIYEIIIFTASFSDYANAIIDYLDPMKKYVSHRFYREHCIPYPQGFYVKDLRIFNRRPEDMVLVDNAAYSFSFQLNNGIPILDFTNDKKDSELIQLAQYLKAIRDSDDLRNNNKEKFKLQETLKYNNLQEAIFKLYF